MNSGAVRENTRDVCSNSYMLHFLSELSSDFIKVSVSKYLHFKSVTIYKKYFFKNVTAGEGPGAEMAQYLRAHTSLAEELGSDPSTN